MIQAEIRPSTGTTPPSAGKSDDFAGSATGQLDEASRDEGSDDPVAAFVARHRAPYSPETAVVLLRSALNNVEALAQQVSCLLGIMAMSSEVNEDMRDALFAVDALVRGMRDLACEEQLIEVAA